MATGSYNHGVVDDYCSRKGSASNCIGDEAVESCFGLDDCAITPGYSGIVCIGV